ncbi:MAG: AraC family transcriptional regulator ligand-binding domain-containing protein [Hyphomicrobium sp.]|nr:AraC family transcriptional regulator ligand-binding domain-containing protein [Hyphomicrobium sp.]
MGQSMGMRLETPTINARLAQQLASYLEARGVSMARLPELDRLLADYADSERNEIPLEGFASVLDRAARLTNDPCFGVHFAEAIPTGASGIYGFLLANARTLGEAMHVTHRYVSLVLDPVEVAFEIFDDVAALRWSVPPFWSADVAQYQLFSTTGLVLRLKAVAGPEWRPLSIEIAHRELPCAAVLRSVLGTDVRFNTAKNAVIVDVASLELKNRTANPDLFAVMREYGDELLERREADAGILADVRRAIRADIGSTDVTLEGISRRLDLPPRTIQQRLNLAGTTFEALLQETRKALATRYLRDTDLSMTDIALILGFSELSAFTRAAMRWYGHPPSVERQSMRARGESQTDNAPASKS